MRFISTRDPAHPIPLSQAMEHGLATDGGLYVPQRIPHLTYGDLPDPHDVPALATRLLEPFFAGDPLESSLPDLCAEAFSFPIPLVPLGDPTQQLSVLELFHGPTAAFKDFGARFLAACLQQIDDITPNSTPRTILVATSGDTGGAVAAAFHRRPGFKVGILFPEGGVSQRQQQQLTGFGDNIHALQVRGTFDDCQTLLKQALAHKRFGRQRLTTANSINIGRLLPQVVYYAVAATLSQAKTGTAPGFIIPTGNVGNAVAALWARAMGFPIGPLVLATNRNRAIPDHLAGQPWQPRTSIKTLANAMDVGNPSNMERVFHFYPDAADLRANVQAISASDAEIERAIAQGPKRFDRVWDPHTATAIHALDQLPPGPQIIVATAHPAKFDTIVEPLIGRSVEVPPSLAELLSRPARFATIEPDLDQLEAALA